MAQDPELAVHREWLGNLQPVGLVVSPPALASAQAFPNKNVIPLHHRFLDGVENRVIPGRADPEPVLVDLPRFCFDVLEWRPEDLVGHEPGEAVLDAFEVALPDYGEVLRPTYAVPEFDRDPSAQRRWQMLIQSIPVGMSLDEATATEGHGWEASPQAKFERLLRETQVPIGLLFNGTHLRLVYAPRGETSGHLTFPVKAMTEVAGRSIFAALVMLVSEERLFSLGEKLRLPAILAESRKYQNLVSTMLAEQVLASLYELLRGFQAADDLKKGELLRDVLADDPNQVYGGLLTTLLRLVFLLYAEDRALISSDPVYVRYYSIGGLFERLRADAGRYPDTMDHRYGAWAQLLVVFRLIHEGGGYSKDFRIPARKGYLFDPGRYPFLEGRNQQDEPIVPPLVADGVVYRVLEKLLILDGERLSYRTLDVEQIGSVYETIMGFVLEIADGRSIAIKPSKPHGAPSAINLDALLQVDARDRVKWIKDRTAQEVTGQSLPRLKAASTVDDLVAALGPKVAGKATPRIVPTGAMVLQPSEERRRSGSHYTPRTLTEPIVETTFRPILERLGPNPTPEQILDLKVCDPAMGSGAFLVAACRFLAELLVRAWHTHKRLPAIPPDEDELLHARRIVAQRCLYGVDKNPMAVDLAKLSLWLATLAKDHPFTFLDHALRPGDSLVGLNCAQIAAFNWNPSLPKIEIHAQIRTRLREATKERLKIHEAPENIKEDLLHQKLLSANEAVNPLRDYADYIVAAYFSSSNTKQRESLRAEYAEILTKYLVNRSNIMLREPVVEAVRRLRSGVHQMAPFHWEIEFPEVFDRPNPGFDAIVGNPPFAGKNTMAEANPVGYPDWLKVIHAESHGNADLVAHFFRRAFHMLREGGAFGLIATNTIGQGDTRSTGLRWICLNGGTIFNARKRLKWPGMAAVVVSVVYVAKAEADKRLTLNQPAVGYVLDGKPVPIITAYLFHAGGHDDPAMLRENAGKSFKGVEVNCMGFVFDDSDSSGVTNPTSLMLDLIAKDSRNGERIFPYLGGEEVNQDPASASYRYVINFGEMTLDEARLWPDLMNVVEEKVKPARDNDKGRAEATRLSGKWWLFNRSRPELFAAISSLSRVLVICEVSPHCSFAMVTSACVFAQTLKVFALDAHSAFAVLQSRTHETWARFFGSSMKDDLRYTPSDCFETFPFPPNYETNPLLEEAGRVYYEFRADLMVRNDEGLTKTYNRFHDPEERSSDIDRLRELHAAMDRAVLDAYGWTDLQPTCEFLLDYEEEDDDEGAPGARRRKKPWRYRWPDDLRDEVLARLLQLNRDRAEIEKLTETTARSTTKKPARSTKKPKDTNPPSLLPD